MRCQKGVQGTHLSGQKALHLVQENSLFDKDTGCGPAQAKPLSRVLPKPDPRNDATERIAADRHPVMTLIATEAQKTPAAITGEEGCMRAHDSHITWPWRLDAIAHVKRINRAQRRVGEMPRLPRNHIDEGFAPRSVKAGWIAIADKPRCHGKHPRISFIGSRAPDPRIAASSRGMVMPMPPLMANGMMSVVMPVMAMMTPLIMMIRMMMMTMKIMMMVMVPMPHRVGFGMT